jgi:ElaB/YqjD/DUF883 family membrane-anchored ribosome-binding protein
MENTDNTLLTDAEISPAATDAAKTAVAARLEQAEFALRDVRDAAGYTIVDVIEPTQTLSEDIVGTAKAYIHLYPLHSVGFGMAIGYLLGYLTKR